MPLVLVSLLFTLRIFFCAALGVRCSFVDNKKSRWSIKAMNGHGIAGDFYEVYKKKMNTNQGVPRNPENI